MKTEIRKMTNPWTEKMFIDEIKNHDAYVLGEVSGKEIIGYICGWEIAGEFEITNVAVSPEFQRHGFGERLVKFIREEKKCRIFFLEVRESNFAARKLYEKLGFKVIGVRKNYYHSPIENALLMAWEKTNSQRKKNEKI
ncbi:MAG: ribosomal-protein-alanine N-acetyltransferase [Candidatus Cloacimonas sp. 4484_275]|nr:MAG: ribosomal-protein-alanine N-acetyltransferase [Candidatus Cloacimonas sp. 4484_275]